MDTQSRQTSSSSSLSDDFSNEVKTYIDNTSISTHYYVKRANKHLEEMAKHPNQTVSLYGSHTINAHSILVLSSRAKNSISKMTNGQMWRSGVKSGCNGSESEGLGFNLCVAPSCVIVSLISEDRVGSEIGDSEMTSLLRTEVRQRVTRKEIQVVEQEEDLRDNAQRGLCWR